MDWPAIIRTVNALLALTCAVGYTHTRILHLRHQLSGDELLLRLGLAMVLFAVSEGCAEAMARGNELVFAQFLLTFGFIGIQVGLWQTRPRREH